MYGRLSGVPSVHVTPYNARSICAVEASKEKHRYVVGTCDVRDDNQIQLLEFNEDRNKIDLIGSYSHPSQIYKITTSPKDESILMTSSSSANGVHSLDMWKMSIISPSGSADPHEPFGVDLQELTPLSTLTKPNTMTSIVNGISWNKKKDLVLTVDSSDLVLWNIGGDRVQSTGTFGLSVPQPSSFVHNAVCWDPHSANSAAIANASNLQIIDTHNMKVTQTKKDVHKYGIRDVDYNPNKPMTLITAGQDRLVKVWDLRRMSRPVKIVCGHTHWVTCARYNPFHDQLIASGGSDFSVNLWRVASCSSSPWVTAPGASCPDDSDDPPDIKVRLVDQHEDSVYSLAWSAVDAWSFCSLSFDGRVIISGVPTTEKYKILL